MGKSLKDNNSSEPAVNQVHGIERDTGELDDRVVTTGQEEERDHVDDGHDTRTAEKFTSTGRETAVVDLPDAESDVDGEITDQEEALKTAGKSTHTEGR